MRHFIDLADWSDQELEGLLETARSLESRPDREALRGKVLALLFMNPSLRTLASFQSGMSRLGGDSFVISPGRGSWELETRIGAVMDGAAAEHVREAVPVLASYADVLGIRAFASGTDLQADVEDRMFHQLAALSPVPVINMESAIDHPCQALADWKTLDDLEVPRSGGRFVLSWAYHPKALPLAVPSAAVYFAARRGMDVTVLRPDGFGLPENVMQRAEAAAKQSGGSLRETDERVEALENAHVLYAKSWTAPADYGDAEAEAFRRSSLRDWCVSESWFEPAAEGCRFMHCLPVRRNVVVRDEVLDGPRSVVVRQARNRMFAQMAVLKRLFEQKETES
ncbi:MAG: N-acetylornithine carbamoyltransferase [Planctomycetota bacterium]